MALKRETPKTIPASVTIIGQGQRASFDVVFRNLTLAEFQKKAEELTASNTPDPDAHLILFVVESWSDIDYDLTVEDIVAANNDRPGFIGAMVDAFMGARRVERVKN